MKNHIMINNFEIGFRKGSMWYQRSCSKYFKLHLQSLDDGFCGVAGMFLDFTKAFVLLDHDILLQKFQFYSFYGREFAFFIHPSREIPCRLTLGVLISRL